MTKKNLTKQWTKYASKRLVGRTITKVAYLTNEECEGDFGWYKRPITFTLDDGKVIIAQMDDEGNDGGVLLIEYPGETVTHPGYPGQFRKTEVLPVLSVGDPNE
tara:strand:+ start:990 stop:1301 length:312 start_codon:yes stop_codon:yes gene_type:complete